LTVYTGTNGVMQLDDVNGNKVDIYLYAEEERVKVPKFYWKLVVNEGEGSAAGVIGVNNPYLSREEADSSEYRLCDSVPSSHFLVAEANDPDSIEQGVLYACTYEELRAAIEEVPDLGGSFPLLE